MPGLGRLVIAPRPTDITAVYGITQVLGGFNSRLGPGRGRVRLHKRSDAVVLRTEFTDDPAWEAASQGGGPSRVLSRPSLGEANPAAWSASALIGGSPGTAEPVAPSTALDGIQINEVLAAPADRSAPFLEFHNRRSVPVSLDGASLRGPNTAESWTFPLASTVPAGGYLAVESETVARLLSPEGGALFLVSPDGTRILDAVHYQGQPPGTSYGRVPDGGPRWSATREPSRGARNSGPRIPDIVFTEVHFAPLDGDEDETFIELYNRSAHPVPLDDWRLAGGASYHFAPGIVLPPGEYLAVARNQVRLRLLHPDLAADRVTGNFSGSLRNQGERITLLRPVYLRNDPNLPPTLPPVLFHAAETEVRYGSGGLWGRWADGGGSSLERVDNDADPCLPGTWRESDESRKAPWSTFELTGTLTLPHPGVPSADQLQILLLGPGEALIDDVEVLVNGANRITNPRFTAGTNGWFFQGTHRTSRLEPGAGPDGSPALRVVATDRGDHVANRIRTALAAPIPANSLVTLRAKARWIHGHPEILLRLRNGSLELVATLLRPSGSGTPGAANSQFTTNAPPTITSVVHSPILPAAGETTRVFARVSDPDAMDSVELTYRRDPSTAIARTPMTDDGTEPDEVAGDGLYTGALPGQTSGTLVAFQIRAVDSRGATTVFPAPVNDSNREALVRFGETVPSGAFGSYRIWMTTASRDAWARREKMSNEDLDVTFVSGTDRVIYNAGAHYSGSSYTAPIYDSPTGALCGYDLTFPGDDRFLGARGATLDWPIRDDTDQREQLMFWFLEQYRLPNLHRRYVRLTVNGARRGTIYDDVQQPDSDTVEEWFPDDSNGSLWKTDCWNEFDNAGNRIDPCILNTLERFPASGPKKTARYRWNWRPRAIQSSANDFSDLFALIDAATASSGYVPAVEALVDIDHWMRTFAMNDLASYWDAFGNPNGKNSFLYKPAHDGWKIFCWDFDVGLGVFNDPPDAPLFEVNDPTLARMYRTPALVRRYWSALQEAVLTWFQTGPGTQIDRLLDARYAAFQTNGVPLANPSGIKSWIRQRRSYLLQQLATVRSDFAITSGGGADYSTTEETVTLSGRAPVGVATLRIQGRDRAVTWNSISNWTTRISLALGLNEIRVEGIDRLGQPVAEATDSVRITYTGSPGPLPALRINEWLALNTGSITNPATGETDDWFELFNAGTSSLDLSGFSISDRTTDPLRSIIPPGFSLAPGRFLLVWADDHPEASRPGGDLHVAFQLSQNGEEIAVFDPLGRLVDRVGFGPQHADVSEGRWPDGSSPPFPRFLVPTPGSLNATPPSPPPGFLLSASRVGTPSEINLRWRSVPGRRYQLEVAAQLETPHWEPVGLSIVADAAETSLIDSNSGSGNRFYRVMLLP